MFLYGDFQMLYSTAVVHGMPMFLHRNFLCMYDAIQMYFHTRNVVDAWCHRYSAPVHEYSRTYDRVYELVYSLDSPTSSCGFPATSRSGARKVTAAERVDGNAPAARTEWLVLNSHIGRQCMVLWDVDARDYC
jgi:hypothetical protein